MLQNILREIITKMVKPEYFFISLHIIFLISFSFFLGGVGGGGGGGGD